MFPYLLSHHPHCVDFADDVYRAGKWRLCIGCFTSYPLAVLTVVIACYIGATRFYEWYSLFGFGVLAGLLHTLSFIRLTRWKPVKIVIKIFLGIGMGLCTYAVFSIPVHLLLRILIFYVLFFIAMNLGGIRILLIQKHCEKCEYKADWFKCPGFGPLSKQMVENNFMYEPTGLIKKQSQ